MRLWSNYHANDRRTVACQRARATMMRGQACVRARCGPRRERRAHIAEIPDAFLAIPRSAKHPRPAAIKNIYI